MLAFSNLSRWLSFSLDPVSIEDWVANREVFGPVEKPTDQDRELERAYLIESLRAKKISAAKDQPVFVAISGLELSGSQPLGKDWLIAPEGRISGKEKKAADLEIKTDGGPKEKHNAAPGDIGVIKLNPHKTHEIKCRLYGGLRVEKKSEIKLKLSGCERLIIDTRGRPIEFDEQIIQRNKNKKWLEELNEN